MRLKAPLCLTRFLHVSGELDVQSMPAPDLADRSPLFPPLDNKLNRKTMKRSATNASLYRTKTGKFAPIPKPNSAGFSLVFELLY